MSSDDVLRAARNPFFETCHACVCVCLRVLYSARIHTKRVSFNYSFHPVSVENRKSTKWAA